MWPESAETDKPLRTGLTTGTCATACCVAASELLLGRSSTNQITVTLPKGQEVSLVVDSCQKADDVVRASTVKDAGDDPDITHGARIFVELALRDASGVAFVAGPGVGTVTRKGLALAVGEPAINDVPRRMMREHLQQQAARFDYHGGFIVRVGVENGEALAQKTMNPRLGIVGGLSILGTSGIVRPFSCAAWIASIHRGMDVASANHLDHIAASTGNTSEAAIQEHYAMHDMALIEMGDFAGAVLKYLKKQRVPKLSICDGFGKISKLAAGHLDLNSRASSIDFQFLAETAAGDAALTRQILKANTSIEVYGIARQQGIDMADAVCRKARAFAREVAGEGTRIEVWAIDRQGDFIGHAGFD